MGKVGFRIRQDAIRYLIEKAGGSQRKLASLSGVSRSAVFRAMHGETIENENVELLCQFGRLSKRDLTVPTGDEDASSGLQKLGAVVQGVAPQCPEVVIGRNDDLSELCRRVTRNPVSDGDQTVQVITTIRGIAGVGKSTVLSRLPYEDNPELRRLSPVLFAPIGKLSRNEIPGKLQEIVQGWGTALSIPGIDSALYPIAKGMLADRLSGHRPLILLDEVWDESLARQLFVGNFQSVTVIATRDGDVASALTPSGGSVLTLECLSLDASVSLLKHFAPDAMAQEPDECLDLAKQLGGVPVFLKPAAGLLRAATDRSAPPLVEVLEEIKGNACLLESSQPPIELEELGGNTPTVSAVLKLSFDDLSQEAQQCFIALGGFPEDPATLTLTTASTFLGFTENTVSRVLHDLVQRGLLEKRGVDAWYLHSTIRAFAASVASRTDS